MIPAIEPVHHLLHPFGDLPGRQPEQVRVQHQVLTHRQFAVEREGLGHVPHPAAGVDVARVDRITEQPGLAFARRQQSREHLHGRRLAAAVRADEAEDFTAVDAEADVIHRSELAEAHREVAGLDGGRFRLVGLGARLDHHGAVIGLGLARQHLDEGLFQRPCLGVRENLLRLPGDQHPSVVHRDEQVQAGGLLHIGGGDQNAHAGPVAADALDEFPELPSGQRINAGGRLVEDEKIRIVDERAAQTQLLLHAARELAGGTVPEGSQPGRTQELTDTPLALGPAVAEQAGEEIHVLEHGECRVQVFAEPLRHVGHPRADRATVARIGHVPPEDLDCSGLYSPGAGNQRKQAGLPDTVRPDHADNPPGGQIDSDPLQRLRPAVAQAHLAQPHHGGGIRRHDDAAARAHCSRFCSKR
jgi:hypothetical protein